jgi:hypothetical protein
MGVDDPRKTVGAGGFDISGGRLDCLSRTRRRQQRVLPQQEAFVDIAHKLGMTATAAAVRRRWAERRDYDDGLGLYVANYGPNELFHNRGGSPRRGQEMGVAGNITHHGCWATTTTTGRPIAAITVRTEPSRLPVSPTATILRTSRRR